MSEQINNGMTTPKELRELDAWIAVNVTHARPEWWDKCHTCNEPSVRFARSAKEKE